MTSGAVSTDGADWRRAVEPYVGPDARRASLQVLTTLAPLFVLMWLVHIILPFSLPVALLFIPLISGFLVRTFILMHDCAHGSFYANKMLSDGIGFITGALTMTPFAQWRRDHALHHASSGDLDRRGHGDVPTLTVREYRAKSWKGRLGYRIIRHPALLLLGGPVHLAVNQRFRGKSTATHNKQLWSVWSTNVAIALLITIGLLTVGWRTVVFAYAIPYYFAAMAGVWLFYVQHQFEDAYWAPHNNWDYAEAALHGSSHLQLPAVLRWFTGNIGLHHVHHTAPRIPNYRLQECHDSNPIFHVAPKITLRSGMSALRLALWDEDRGRLIKFSDLSASS